MFFQPWWTEDAGTRCDDEDMAAVAAAKRFGVRPRDVKYIVAYPAYVVMLGPYKDVVVPDMRKAPWWPGELFRWKSIINSGLQHLPDVPDWKDAPPWWEKMMISKTLAR